MARQKVLWVFVEYEFSCDINQDHNLLIDYSWADNFHSQLYILKSSLWLCNDSRLKGNKGGSRHKGSDDLWNDWRDKKFYLAISMYAVKHIHPDSCTDHSLNLFSYSLQWYITNLFPQNLEMFWAFKKTYVFFF